MIFIHWALDPLLPQSLVSVLLQDVIAQLITHLSSPQLQAPPQLSLPTGLVSPVLWSPGLPQHKHLQIVMRCSIRQLGGSRLSGGNTSNTEVTLSGLTLGVTLLHLCESTIWSRLMHFLGTSHIKSTAYHPIANDLVGCFHCQLKAALKSQPQITGLTYFPW